MARTAEDASTLSCRRFQGAREFCFETTLKVWNNLRTPSQQSFGTGSQLLFKTRRMSNIKRASLA